MGSASAVRDLHKVSTGVRSVPSSGAMRRVNSNNKTMGSASGTAGKSENRRMSNAERSEYFARREAAKILRRVLEGDAHRRAVASIKSLVYAPSVRNKKGTFALVCKTLKYLPVIKDVLEAADLLSNKWKRQKELIYVVMYDILLGQKTPLVGDAEKFLMRQQSALQSVVAQILSKRKVNKIEDLIGRGENPGDSKPRFIRVNTLKMDVHTAINELGKKYAVQKDDLVPDLLVLPPGSDLHNHPLIANGSIFMQGKASSMVAVALDPKPGWEVLDACSAPGNKTVHLASLMNGKGRIIACELNENRVRRLQDTIKLSGASNIEVLHGDFLSLNPEDPSLSKVRAILLDPSCSGSGTASARLDHLLPSHVEGKTSEDVDLERLNKLAGFQRKALEHAFSFPAVEKIVYSTCSIHQVENEDVVQSLLPLAESQGFQLDTPFPQWQRRGLPVFAGANHLLRTDPIEDKEGFFIALFKKQQDSTHPFSRTSIRDKSSRNHGGNGRNRWAATRLSKMWLYAHSTRTRWRKNCTPSRSRTRT